MFPDEMQSSTKEDVIKLIQKKDIKIINLARALKSYRDLRKKLTDRPDENEELLLKYMHCG